NAEVRGEPIPTLPFVTSSVSTTPKCEDEAYTDSAIGLNLRTIGAPPRFVIYSDSSHHSGANIAKAEVDSFARPSVSLMTVATTVTSIVDPAITVKEKFIESSVFGSDSSGSGADYIVGGFFDLIVGGIRTVISPDTDLQKVYVPQWSVTNGSRLDNGRICHEIVDEFPPPKFFASIRVRMHAEYNIRERRRLSSIVEEKNSLLIARNEELESLKAQLLVKEAEAVEAIHLHDEAFKFEVVERSLQDEVKVREQEVADLDAQVTFSKCLSDNFADREHELEASFAGLHEKMALHFEEKFYSRLLTTIFGCRWLLTHDMELAIAKCLNSTEYLSTLGAAIGKAVEKGMQEGLSAGITHGAKGKKLTDLRANKDASIDTIMNLLRLEDTLAERLDVSSSRVRKIKENIANHVSALRDVFVPLSEPLSIVALEGTEGISSGALGTADTTTALSIVVASTSIVRPISIDNYEVTGADDQATADRNVADKDANPFPNVDDAELNVSE
ncbi:hypothetical protein Tco_1436150, partial [Tanacetum coccineum]